MIKKLLFLLVLLLTATTGAVAQDPWDSGDCTVTLSNGTLTVSGTGAMADYKDYNFVPWDAYRSDVETIVIESGVTSIGNFALSRFINLESVSIPASVTSIGTYAFEDCGSNAEALTVSFAEGSTPLTISENAFYGAKLTSIDIPNRVTSIGGGAFASCSNLESVSIPASVTSIGAYAFGFCGKLAKVYIYAPSLTTYGAMAFDNNATGRKIYVLPDAVDTYKTGWSAYATDIEAMPTYAITLAEGTEDATDWTVKVGEKAAAFPVEGLEGGEKITVTYSGKKKVKSVKAVKKEVGPEVTSFSELQAVLSAGKDVKLMNDIVCTAEIEIKSEGALTIDGNGKTLSTTSEIRAFKVGSSATVAFKNLTLTGFVSGGSPAINNNGGTIVLDGCTISNCHVSGGQGGGAIENKGGGKLYAINTTFSGNYSGEIGGAINNYGGSLYMSGCTFTDNYTTSNNAFYGGAIGINGGSEIRLINCAFSGNKYGSTAGNNDIGVYSKPTNDNYTIAGCTGATIASAAGDITTNASGTATLDYSDLSNISFTYTPITVTWNNDDITGSDMGTTFTKDGVTITAGDIDFEEKNFKGGGTFSTTLGNFTKIEVTTSGWYASGTGWSGSTWTGNASSVSFSGDIYCYGEGTTKFVFTIEPTN